MINKTFFTKLKKDYNAYNKGRGDIIVISRDILKFSKEAIFACHRNQLDQASKSLAAAEKIIKDLQKKMKSNPDLSNEGSFYAGVEEYAEARLLFNYLKTGKVDAIKEVSLTHETYIGALSDFTGELIRKAIADATKRDIGAVEQSKNVIEEIVDQFIQFDLLKNLRSKYDAAKKNLRKIEEILYDLSMSESRNK